MFALYISQSTDLHCKLIGKFLCDWYHVYFSFLIKSLPKKFIFYNFVICLICVSQIILTACSYHVTNVFQSKSTLCTCLRVKESMLETSEISEVLVTGTVLEQGVPWRSGNYSVQIHSETRTWNDKNIQLNAPHK